MRSKTGSILGHIQHHFETSIIIKKTSQVGGYHIKYLIQPLFLFCLHQRQRI